MAKSKKDAPETSSAGSTPEFSSAESATPDSSTPDLSTPDISLSPKASPGAAGNPNPSHPSHSASIIRDRIVALERIPASLLQPNPKNPRHHPPAQARALKRLLERVGIADVAIARKLPDGTYHLLDGHLRQSLLPEHHVPTLIVDLNDHEAEDFLLHLDPIAGMAEIIESNYKDILSRIKPDPDVQNILNKTVRAQEKLLSSARASVQEIARAQSADLTSLLAPALATESPSSLAHSDPTPFKGASREDIISGNIEAWDQEGAAAKPENYRGVYALREDVMFPSSNQYGIPDLRTDLLSPLIPQFTWGRDSVGDPASTFFVWGTGPWPPDHVGGTLGFFAHDYLFESIWFDTFSILEKIKGEKWGAICTPDFSTWWDWPFAIKLYNLYRSRWVARYYQEAGIPIIPGLMFTGDPAKAEIECCGLPHRPPVVICECRAGFTKEKDKIRPILLASLNRQLAIVEPETLVIYGGLNNRDWLEPNIAKGPRVVYLESWISVRRRVNPNMRKQTKGKKKSSSSSSTDSGSEE